MQSAFYDKKALSASLIAAEPKSRHLESEAREAINRAVHVEVERDAPRHDLAMARLEIKAASSSQAQV